MRTNKLISAFSVLLILLAITRLMLDDKIAGRMDNTFFILIALALLLHIIPFEKIKSVKAAGIELTLELPQVKSAIDGLGLNGIRDEILRLWLSHRKDELETIRGSRVLWVDDHPDKVIEARRLLRALGVETVTAVSSEKAEEVLKTDNDFDLIITDVSRKGDSYKLTGGLEGAEGVNFIVKLRTIPLDPDKNMPDPVIKSMPVMFYAAYASENLIKYIRPASETLPKPEMSNTVSDLIIKVVRQLAAVRSKAITYSEKKIGTRPK
ncbi:MAG TPA: response regulator [Pyrinomonadaceae bacterium]|nr:response regulator [Pyrinomonadaceae bacterium]